MWGFSGVSSNPRDMRSGILQKSSNMRALGVISRPTKSWILTKFGNSGFGSKVHIHNFLNLAKERALCDSQLFCKLVRALVVWIHEFYLRCVVQGYGTNLFVASLLDQKKISQANSRPTRSCTSARDREAASTNSSNSNQKQQAKAAASTNSGSEHKHKQQTQAAASTNSRKHRQQKRPQAAATASTKSSWHQKQAQAAAAAAQAAAAQAAAVRRGIAGLAGIKKKSRGDTNGEFAGWK